MQWPNALQWASLCGAGQPHSAQRALLGAQTKIVGEPLMMWLSGQEVGRVLDKNRDNR